MKQYKTVYLSGSISGRSKEDAELHFKAVQHWIEEQTDAYVYNPMEFKERDCWEDYMRDGISALMDSDAILMLDGWQESRGASLERHIALELKIPIFYEHTTLWASSEN